jgi:hypothetical protein
LIFAREGRELYLASSTARSVTVVDLATRDRSACAPAGLVPMGDVLRMTEIGTGPLWLVDAGGKDPRIVFAPTMR